MRAYILEDGEVNETTDLEVTRAAITAKKPVWIDLDAKESAEVGAFLEHTLAIHPLTVEDIWADRESPKVDDFGTYIYICAHALKRDRAVSDELVPIEIDIVVSPLFVVTHDNAATTTESLREEIKRSSRLLARGAPWVAHAALDRLVDAYLPLIDGFDDDISSLEDQVLATAGTPAGTAVLGRILTLKRSLQTLRRVSIHQRELLLRLARGEFAAFPQELLPYLRDVHDHFVRVGDLAESYRDLVTSALDVYLSVQSNRMNEVMKTLTLISTVMLPLTFIAGVYGMNFEHMPELKWLYGYPFAIGLMGSVAITAVLWFRHKKWLS